MRRLLALCAVTGLAVVTAAGCGNKYAKSQVADTKCGVGPNGTLQASGRIRNPEPTAHSYSITAEVADNSGKTIGSAAGTVTDLPGGKDRAFVLKSTVRPASAKNLHCAAWEIAAAT